MTFRLNYHFLIFRSSDWLQIFAIIVTNIFEPLIRQDFNLRPCFSLMKWLQSNRQHLVFSSFRGVLIWIFSSIVMFTRIPYSGSSVLKFQLSLWSLLGLFTFLPKSQFYLKVSTTSLRQIYRVHLLNAGSAEYFQLSFWRNIRQVFVPLQCP